MIPDLPVAVTNNAVAIRKTATDTILYSLLGLGETKRYDAITNHCAALSIKTGMWSSLPYLPDVGRIAATAQSVGSKLFLFGGYTVSDAGAEHTSASVNIFEPASNSWSRGADIPVPVDDAVSVSIDQRYIYLVSGWSETKNVRNVQVYDTVNDKWSVATPIAGKPLFGHCGAAIGRKIFYFDGVSDEGHKFQVSNVCWMGEISSNDCSIIQWTELPPHPGRPRYRCAAGSDQTRYVVLAGGTDNPYNYDGVGYDGKPSNPVDDVAVWDSAQGTWTVQPRGPMTMDHRGLLRLERSFVTVGGMKMGQAVTKSVIEFQI